MKQVVITAFLFLLSLGVKAQGSVEAKISRVEMMIGEQAILSVSAISPKGAAVVFPEYHGDSTMVAGIEVLSHKDEPVIAASEEGMECHVRNYLLTAFDGALYYLPPLAVQVGNKTIKTKSLALKVLEVEVDTTQMDKFFPPKDVQDNPFLWSEWSAALWLSILLMLECMLLLWLYVRLRSGKPIKISLKPIKRILPHQKAMEQIALIKASNLVSSENSKEYYTRLTDTLRKYIEERYHFSAMEMTSSEIIERLTSEQDAGGIGELKELFVTADLVKFAKYSTLINENDKNLLSAIDFINATKVEALPQQEQPKPQLTEQQQKVLFKRRWLRVVVVLLFVQILALLGYVVYQIADIMAW